VILPSSVSPPKRRSAANTSMGRKPLSDILKGLICTNESACFIIDIQMFFVHLIEVYLDKKEILYQHLVLDKFKDGFRSAFPSPLIAPLDQQSLSDMAQIVVVACKSSG